MTLRYTGEERAAFIREHRGLEYASSQHVEREMEIDDAARSLALAERYMQWLMVILDPESPAELKTVAAEMIYLTCFMDLRAGKGLP